jgi:hypothetical protein
MHRSKTCPYSMTSSARPSKAIGSVKARTQVYDSGDITTGMVETADNAGLDRIDPKRKNNWYRRGSRFGGESSGCSPRGNHSDIAVDEIGCQMRQPIIVTLGPPVFDHNIATIDVTGFCEAAPKSCRLRFTKAISEASMQKSNDGHGRLLRTNRNDEQAIAPPPTSVMNSRRLTRSPRRR